MCCKMTVADYIFVSRLSAKKKRLNEKTETENFFFFISLFDMFLQMNILTWSDFDILLGKLVMKFKIPISNLSSSQLISDNFRKRGAI